MGLRASWRLCSRLRMLDSIHIPSPCSCRACMYRDFALKKGRATPVPPAVALKDAKGNVPPVFPVFPRSVCALRVVANPLGGRSRAWRRPCAVRVEAAAPQGGGGPPAAAWPACFLRHPHAFPLPLQGMRVGAPRGPPPVCRGGGANPRATASTTTRRREGNQGSKRATPGETNVTQR